MLLSGPNVIAQDAISNIRSHYKVYTKQITNCKAQSENCVLYSNTLMLNSGKQHWRAVENYNKEITFWYDDSPEHCYECGKNGINSLKFVSSSAISGTSKIYNEWLFKEGMLVFHYLKIDGEYPSEIRYYFDDNILIRYIENGEQTNGSAAHAKDTDNIKNKAQQLQKSFLLAFE